MYQCMCQRWWGHWLLPHMPSQSPGTTPPSDSLSAGHPEPATTPLTTFFNIYTRARVQHSATCVHQTSSPITLYSALATPPSTSRGQQLQPPTTDHRPHSGLSHPSNGLPKARIAPEPTRLKRDLNTCRQTPHWLCPTSSASSTFPFDSTWRTLALAQKPMVACASGPRPNPRICITPTRLKKRYSH
jgi:hypothetical protein